MDCGEHAGPSAEISPLAVRAERVLGTSRGRSTCVFHAITQSAQTGWLRRSNSLGCVLHYRRTPRDCWPDHRYRLYQTPRCGVVGIGKFDMVSLVDIAGYNTGDGCYCGLHGNGDDPNVCSALGRRLPDITEIERGEWVLIAEAAVQDLGSSSGLLMFILGGGLIGLVISAYKFVVNFRTTERGMARQRIQQANRGERAAQYEAGLWQARCADLEYLIRRELGPERVPRLTEELREMIKQSSTETGAAPPVEWNTPPTSDTGGKSKP
jgi:hypothetical protein